MSLMRKIIAICKNNPSGIDVEQIAKLCPEASRKQVIAAARNAFTRGHVNRLSMGGLGAAAALKPAVYGPPLPDQKPLPCVSANTDPEYKREAMRRSRAQIPLNPVGRVPVNSVWALAA
jgi:hypothetical protein